MNTDRFRRTNGPTMAALFAAALVSLLSACISHPYTSSRTYVIRQSAMVKGPTGPSVGGPLVSGGDVALEASYFGVPTSRGGERSGGEPGHVVFDRGLGLRFTAGAEERFEAGVGTSLAHSSFTSPTASDIDSGMFRPTLAISVDPHIRMNFIDTPRLKLFGLAEFRGSLIPYNRTVYETERKTSFGYDPGSSASEDGTLELTKEKTVQSESHSRRKAVILPAAGIGTTVGFTDNLFVSLGGYGQQVPVFFGQKITHETCVNSTGDFGDERCTGESPSEVDALSRSLVLSTFGSLNLRLGGTLVRLQGFYHFASGSDWPRHVPGGARIAVRQSF